MGNFIISGCDLQALNVIHNQMLQWITYLDTCSLGKSSDMDNALHNMAQSLYNAKKICNKAIKL